MLGNWISQTTTTTGTGALTLAAVTGYPTFAAQFVLGQRFEYMLLNDDGTPLEAGIGYLASTTSLVREFVKATYSAGTYNDNGATAVALGAGSKRVICAVEAGNVRPGLSAVQTAFGANITFPDGLQLSSNGKTLGANTPIASCLFWPGGKPITGLAVSVSTAAGSGADRIQAGLYSVLPSGLPGDLICRSGDMLPNTTGNKVGSLVGGNRRLPAGWYWWVVASSINPVVLAYNGGNLAHGAIATPMGTAPAYGWNARNSMFQAAALASGWTALPQTITLAYASSVTSDFAPTVGAITL